VTSVPGGRTVDCSFTYSGLEESAQAPFFIFGAAAAASSVSLAGIAAVSRGESSKKIGIT